MEIIKYSNLSIDELKRDLFGVPFFICTDSTRVIKRFEDSNYQRISVNKSLVKLLLEFDPSERPRRVEQLLNKVLHDQDACIVNDFEMLFDPRYEIDVVKYFCEQARKRNIAIKWPGRFMEGMLTYAEPRALDYHEYYCDDYQMRIVL